MAKPKQSSRSRFPAAHVGTPSPFRRQAANNPKYDYWAASPQLSTARRGSRRARLAPDVYAPPGEPPRYYSVAWQVILWLACTALMLFMMFG